MRGKRTVLAPLALGAGLLSGCAANRNLVVVLPEGNGHVGAVVVRAGAGSAVLDKAYAAAAPTPAGAHLLKPGAVDAAKVRAIFGGALDALPVPPAFHTVDFEFGSRSLGPEETADICVFLETIRGRKAVEIVVTGYTDSTGADDYNDRLSLERAEAVRQALLPILAAFGVPPAAVTAVGRGKRDALVDTPDQTREPRNRRVEITVR